MILVTLENCEGCIIFKALHPELPVITIPTNTKGPSEGNVLKAKKTMTRLGVKAFPCLLTDDLTERILISDFDPDVARKLDLE